MWGAAATMALGFAGLAAGPVAAATIGALLVGGYGGGLLLAPLTIGALADATSITSALLVVPAMLALAAIGPRVVARR